MDPEAHRLGFWQGEGAFLLVERGLRVEPCVNTGPEVAAGIPSTAVQADGSRVRLKGLPQLASLDPAHYAAGERNLTTWTREPLLTVTSHKFSEPLRVTYGRCHNILISLWLSNWWFPGQQYTYPPSTQETKNTRIFLRKNKQTKRKIVQIIISI